MKTFVVSWDERHVVTLEAENETEAIKKVYEGDFKPEDEGAEMNGSYEAQEIKLK